MGLAKIVTAGAESNFLHKSLIFRRLI